MEKVISEGNTFFNGRARISFPHTQLGIIPEEPGFKKVKIEPKPAGLKWVRGSMPTPHGKIEVSWEKTKNMFKIEVCLPHGVTGRLLLPEFIGRNTKFEISGNYTQSPVFTGKNWQLHLKRRKSRVIVAARTGPTIRLLKGEML